MLAKGATQVSLLAGSKTLLPNWLGAGLLLHGCKINFFLYANFLVKIILNIHNSDTLILPLNIYADF